ncbi:MAG: hypothetical protein NPIRA03_17730 [Nitrospirales bacterium]|nr:MAG: hypothetical protein NPIRA03_17730 [Nitrospirales bacterium]
MADDHSEHSVAKKKSTGQVYSGFHSRMIPTMGNQTVCEESVRLLMN